ncbi:MAG: type II toxin-antitoxin system PemK/MazF family toxin [Nitrospinae bacterium]|nr:type II toxin-antitoxin system PemK/MazF family toxin [Nitrospinota bacterium]
MPKRKYRRGEVILVPFTSSDFSGGKTRPALIISTPAFTACEGDYLLAAITGQVAAHTGHPTCHELQDWQAAGLAITSVVTSHLITLSTSSMGVKAGKLSARDMAEVKARLRQALGI